MESKRIRKSNPKKSNRQVKIKRRPSSAKQIKVNPWKVVVAVIVVLLLIFAISVISGSKPKQTKKFSSAKGSWILDCRYIDTKADTLPLKTTMTMDDSSMVVTTYKEDVPVVTDDSGKKTTDKKADTTDKTADTATDDETSKNTDEIKLVEDIKTTYSIKGSNGKISASSGSESIQYTFLYDKGAEVLHLYHNDSSGSVIHEVYRHNDK